MISDTEMDEFIQKVARNVAGNFPSYISTRDTAAHVWCWYMDNEQTVSKLIRDDESWGAKLYGTMTRVATDFALKEEAAVNGYSPEDVYFYSTTVIKELLKDAFDYEDWQSFSTFGDGQPRSKGQVNETGNRMAMLADVKRATEGLAERHYNIILWHYKYGVDFKDLSEILEISESGARKALERAVKAIQKQLGKKSLADMRNGWDERTERFTNTQAQAQVQRDYEG